VTQDALIREIQGLRTQIQALHVHVASTQARGSVRHGWLKPLVHDLEYNPKTQYKVHFYAAVYWLLNFPVILFIFFAYPEVWLQVGLLVTLVYSIYANLATDYGAMSSALAAMQQAPLPEIPLEVHE
jgi:hypothetical protein